MNWDLGRVELDSRAHKTDPTVHTSSCALHMYVSGRLNLAGDATLGLLKFRFVWTEESVGRRMRRALASQANTQTTNKWIRSMCDTQTHPHSFTHTPVAFKIGHEFMAMEIRSAKHILEPCDQRSTRAPCAMWMCKKTWRNSVPMPPMMWWTLEISGELKIHNERVYTHVYLTSLFPRPSIPPHTHTLTEAFMFFSFYFVCFFFCSPWTDWPLAEASSHKFMSSKSNKIFCIRFVSGGRTVK